MLQDEESFEYKGRKYKLTPDIRNVLLLLDALNNCFPWERGKLISYFLTDGKTPKSNDFVNALIKHYFPPSNENGERVIDLHQDFPYIYAAFIQAYGIDLYKGLSWFRFRDLLSALPADTTYSKILQIRTRPIPPVTKSNAEERANLIRLKEKYAIKKSRSEISEGLQKDLKNLADTLIGVAKHG